MFKSILITMACDVLDTLYVWALVASVALFVGMLTAPLLLTKYADDPRWLLTYILAATGWWVVSAWKRAGR